ncbi:hypothetical protein Tco_1359524 [Tanacetum coccineum]
MPTQEDKSIEEGISNTSKPPGFENFVKENKECDDRLTPQDQDIGLIDLPMGGRNFTWMNKVVALDRVWSDHNPILLHSKKHDFGPTPFKVFHSWFNHLDFEAFVKDRWVVITDEDSKFSKPLHIKLKDLKSYLKLCDEKATRINKLQELDNLKNLESMDLVQKARVKWDVEGDENSKFFHGLINSRRKYQMINGIMQEGVWLSEPKDIKEAFFNFYKDKFSCHDSHISFPSFVPVHRLNKSDRDFLKDMVFMDEIKMVVWDCGSHKAPGLDGYSFMFIKKFWDLLKHDIHSLKINIHKSNVFRVVVLSSEIVSMAACTGCEAGSLPFSYLGLPIGSNMRRIVNWQVITYRFKARLSRWKDTIAFP